MYGILITAFILDFLELSARRGEYTGIGLGVVFFFSGGEGGQIWGWGWVVVVDFFNLMGERGGTLNILNQSSSYWEKN